MSAGQGPDAGQEIAGYRLLHTLGAGGASEVFLAQRLDDPSALVAMKILRPVAGLDPASVATLEARFLREADAAHRLSHPHILPVLSYGREDGFDYMALPFMPGGTLTARINTYTRGMPLPVAADYLTQLASALDYAHERGVIHRDVKPANILLDADERLLLADFGVARVFASTGQGAPATLTVEGQLLGTPAYMAPEQLDGPHVSRQADIYALGVTLYQMVTGGLPFEADTPIALAMRRLQTEPPPPRRDRADLPAPAQAAILRALARRPEDRFATAGALARAFDAGVRGQLAPEEVAVSERLDGGPAPSLLTHSGASTVAATAPPLASPPAPRDGASAAERRSSRPSAPSLWRAQHAPTQPDPRIGRRGGGAPALWMLMGIVLTLVAITAGVIFGGPITSALGLSGSGLGIFGGAGTVRATHTAAPGASATGSPASAACQALPGFGAATAPAYAGATYPDVPFPPDAVSAVYQTFADGNYHFILLDVCAPKTSAASVRRFYAQAMLVNNWTPSATFPYAGQPDKACGDIYCWTKGASPARYASLERVTTHGAQVTFQLRLGNAG